MRNSGSDNSQSHIFSFRELATTVAMKKLKNILVIFLFAKEDLLPA